jgi:dipeptidyl aminopeptidase/acylaminoacyl peptidase
MSVTTPNVTSIYPERKATRPMRPEDLWAIPRVGNPEVSPDGSALAVTVTTYDMEKNEGRGRIWIVPARGGEPRALTSAETSSGAPAFSPDGRRLAFTRKDEKGKAQLHAMPLDGGEAEKLTDLPLGVFDPSWLPDGSGIVFGAMLIRGHLTPEASAAELERRDKDPVKAHVTEDRVYRYWDTWLTTGEVPHLFVFGLADRTLRDLTPQSTLWFDWMDPSGQYDISPDGTEIAFSGIFADPNKSGLVRSALHIVPSKGGAVECLTADHPSDDLRPRYSPDGKTIVYGMQHDPYFYADRVRMMAFDRATRAHREIIGDWDFSPSNWTFASDGTLFLEAEDQARTSLFRWSGSGTPARVWRGGTLSGIAAGRGGRIYFTHQSLTAPPEVYGGGADGGGIARLTRFTDSTAPAFSTGEVREMLFEGEKGETVQMFVVLPPGFQETKRYPFVKVIHGGPHGASADAFSFRWNPHAFAAPGYVVALVNFQGSTGWGQDFAKRIQGGWGDLPYGDVMKATDSMLATGWIDEKKMAAAGGSYGGYMASWIEGNTDRFACIVNHAGVYNLLSQYASDVTQGRAQSMGGEPWDHIEGIDRYNPARTAKGFKTPMLVLHGERDFRVPVTQGLECYGVLKAKGIEARLVYFPDENHWILKPRNSVFWYGEVLGWLKRFIG